jgi:hypothetical protein
MVESDPRERGLTRSQLLRVLALDEQASAGEVQRRGIRLLRVLRARSQPEDRARREIERLEEALSRHARDAAAERRARPTRGRARIDRASAVAIVLGIASAAIAFWITSADREGSSGPPSLGSLLRLAPAKLVLTGALPEATLRVLDADRARVLHERPAQDAVIELRPGRYAVEVTRPGCPESWTRSLYLESGTTRTFAPGLCSGEGALRVRANVQGARILVDDDLVGTSDAPPIPLPVGEHALRVEKPGHRAHESRIRVRADETLEVQVELAPQRPGAEGADAAGALHGAVPTLAPALVQAPEPFDLGELRSSIAPPKSTGRDSRLLQRAGLGALPDGGSTAWHDRVSNEFLRRFDLDGSGRIGRIEARDEIGCEDWRETEASFELGGLGLSMARYYGFDGTEWHSGALGFDRALRGAAYARMRACGLQA